MFRIIFIIIIYIGNKFFLNRLILFLTFICLIYSFIFLVFLPSWRNRWDILRIFIVNILFVQFLLIFLKVSIILIGSIILISLIGYINLIILIGYINLYIFIIVIIKTFLKVFWLILCLSYWILIDFLIIRIFMNIVSYIVILITFYFFRRIPCLWSFGLILIFIII